MNALLKWPGGKRKLAKMISEEVSQHLSKNGRFIELFAGSAAVFFELEPSRAVLVDACKPLISFYEAIQRDPDAFSDELEVLLDMPFEKETYMRIRSGWNGRDFGIKFAARLLYLNKLCFNGLFRLNSKLGFNAAWGKKKKLPSFPDREEIRAASVLLNRAKLYNSDFSKILRSAKHGDVIYADPPYWGTYDSHAGGSFTEEDQARLSKMLKSAAGRGVKIIASNIDCEEIRGLYEPWADIRVIQVAHVIGRTKESRKKVSEVFMHAGCSALDTRQAGLFDRIGVV